MGGKLQIWRAVSGAFTAVVPCAAPLLTGVVQGTVSAATYAATEKIAYGRDPSLKDVIEVGVKSGVMAGGMQYIGQELGFVQCFIAGTLVSTKAGLVPIEDIQPGDLVWATDEETGETALKEVVQIFRNETEEWVHVTVNGETITCTPNHPFYSPVEGWTSAIDLRAGDILVMLNGEYVIIEQVQHEILESPVTTYNFEVEGFHTYFVGETGVLVHNSCGMSNSEATAAAKEMGYTKVNGRTSHGKAIFTNPDAPSKLRYITADANVHNGGAWKAASSIENLFSKSTRSGTYDILLNWIGK